MKPELRDFALREIGCVVAHILGIGWLPAEKHHLLTTGLHGNGKRRGEQATVGLNLWSHRGVVLPGWSTDQCRDVLGPSYAREPAAFRALYSDDVLLREQERLLRAWQMGNVVAFP
jgi:hypothetical protein